MTTTRRILLADDHALVRAGIRALLESLPGVEVVGETGDGLEAVEHVRRDPPDAILLDITLPGLNGLEAAARIAKLDVPTRVLMLSMHASAEYAARALAAGAAGYLNKDSAFDELATALEEIFAGRRYLCRAIDAELVQQFERRASTGESELDALTPRQRQILQLVAEGPGHPADRRAPVPQRQDGREPPHPDDAAARHLRRAGPGAFRHPQRTGAARSDLTRGAGPRPRAKSGIPRWLRRAGRQIPSPRPAPAARPGGRAHRRRLSRAQTLPLDPAPARGPRRGARAAGRPGRPCHEAEAAEPHPAHRGFAEHHRRQGHPRDRRRRPERHAVHGDHHLRQRQRQGRAARRRELHVPAVRPARAAQAAERQDAHRRDAGRLPALGGGRAA